MQTTDRPRDRYDQEVERLTELMREAQYPHEFIDAAWSYGRDHSPLFDGCCLSRNSICGCLTQVRDDFNCDSLEPGLRIAIQADERIPAHEEDIAARHLPIFAEWQRKIDLALGRNPPAMLEQ